MRRCRCSKEETRDRILTKAQELFRLYGFGKTTVADIAAGLGMSPANVYKFFPSKSAIVESCAARGVDTIRAEVTKIVESDGSAMDRIGRVVLTIYRFNREMLRNERQIFQLAAAAMDGAWPCMRAYRDFLHKAMTRLVSEGMNSGEFTRAPAPRVATALLDCLGAPLRAHLNPDYEPGKNQERRIRTQINFLAGALQFSQ